MLKMAMHHVTCHTNDIYPKSFPPPRPTARNHGYVSDYEHPHIMHDSMTSPLPVSVHGGFDAITRDELPVFQRAPVPTQCELGDLASLIDPDLCITPEKTVKSASRLGLSQSSGEDVHRKGPHRVRFDSTVDVRQLLPRSQSPSFVNSSLCSDISVEEVIGPTLDAESASLDGSPKARTYQYNVDDLRTHDFPPVNTTSSRDRYQDASMKLNRKVASKHPSAEQSVMDDITRDYRTTMEPEHVLTRAEFNSTLRVKKEMIQLRDAELDLVPALEKKLKLSEKKRNIIKEKAVSRVNHHHDAFAANLCQIEPRKEDVAVSVEQALSSKVKPFRRKQPKAEDSLGTAPDIMEFFTPDLQKEIPSLTLRGVPTTQHKARTASSTRAFDVYSHIRSWEQW